MNRRDLLKKLAAAPVVAAVAPAVLAEAPRDFDTADCLYVAHYRHVQHVQTFKIVDDGVALNSVAHPVMEGDFDTANMRYKSHELSVHAFEEIELEFPEHVWRVIDRAVCIHCGLTLQFVEDNPADIVCWARVANERKQALIESFNQTWAETLRKVGPWP